MKIEFDIFNREFFRTLTFSLKFKIKDKFLSYTCKIQCFLYLPVQRELEVLCSKNIIRNFIPMVKMFWLSGTADYFETDYHWQQMLAIGNNSGMNAYFWFIL